LTKTIDEIDGHTGGTMYWTVANSKYIDEHGWDAWFVTDHAQGYTDKNMMHTYQTMRENAQNNKLL